MYLVTWGLTMFGLFKRDPIKELESKYNKLNEQAVHAQRNGKIEQYAKLAKEADDILKQIEELEKQPKK